MVDAIAGGSPTHPIWVTILHSRIVYSLAPVRQVAGAGRGLDTVGLCFPCARRVEFVDRIYGKMDDDVQL